ncbi:MAG TPA: EAL domain-containing protein [Acidimicrobiales bacterium]|nr:EAL domain-containing protein [Acidimicrobiales bacterium]
MGGLASGLRARMLDQLGRAVLGADLEFRVNYWNRAAEEMFGWSSAEVLGREVLEVTGGELHTDRGTELLEQLNGGQGFSEELWMQRREGGRFPVLASVTPMMDGDRMSGIVAVLIDITDRIRIERASEERRERLEEAQLVANLGSFELELASGVEVWTGQYYRILGVDPVTTPSVELFTSLVHPDDRPAFDNWLAEFIDGDEPELSGRWRIVRPDGGIRWLEVRARFLFNEAGRRVKVVGTALDVTEHRETEDARKAAEEQFRLGFERGALGMAMVDLDGFITRVNPALCVLLGRSGDDIVGHTADDFLHPEDPPASYEVAGERMLDEGLSTTALERRLLRPDGEVVWAMVDVALVRTEEGAPQYFFAQIQDVTERKRSEAAFEHLALHDPLTGLPNRLLLQDRLAGALARARRHDQQVAVVFADIDHFKLVNDTLGHSAGDQLLIEVAKRVSKGTRAPDTVGRFGGDELVMICEELEEAAQAEAFGARVMGMFDAPFNIEGHELFITVSCGLVVAGPDDTPMTVLRDADAAMYRAKELGRARVELFDHEFRQRAARRLELESSLRHALERNELRLVYQPIIALASGLPVGAESLLRWDLPEGDSVPPAEFIPVAEQCGLITLIGEWVIDEAVAQVMRWRRDLPGAADLWVSVNLSSRQLAPDVVTICERALAKHGAPGSAVSIEITESILMDDVESSIEVLCRLRALGILAAIDDFGTGYSSLEYLKRLPLRVLKIDRSFVDGLGLDPQDSSIVNAIVSLGRAMDLEPCAEGVETAAQLQELVALGCCYGQGHLWAPALRPEEFERWHAAMRDDALGSAG